MSGDYTKNTQGLRLSAAMQPPIDLCKIDKCCRVFFLNLN